MVIDVRLTELSDAFVFRNSNFKFYSPIELEPSTNAYVYRINASPDKERFDARTVPPRDTVKVILL
jgi:hypothetical protein